VTRPPTSVIALGGSAGSIEPLLAVVRALPAELPAAVLVVVHLSPTVPSYLAGIVARSTALDVAHLGPSGSLRSGAIYVAPPDHHLEVDAQGYILRRGPRENGHRPAIDPLFRSVAQTYGANGVAVVLSGMLDDGTAGLHAVADAGGVAIVQDPAGAVHRSMPSSALAHTSSARVVAIDGLAPLLVELAQSREEPPARRAVSVEPATPAPHAPDRTLICPECGGPLSESENGSHVAFACVLGHAYSAQSLTEAQAEVVERALWTASRALEDRAALTGRLAERLGDGETSTGKAMMRRGREAAHAAEVIRSLLGTANGDAGAKP
jgi:two-component system chemotaxis response regulator CheB